MEMCANAIHALSWSGIINNCIFTKEMFAAGFSILGALLGAFIGGRAARRAAVEAIAEQRAVDDHRAHEDHRRRQRTLAYALQAEMTALRDHYREYLQPPFWNYRREQPAPGIAASSLYFTVFDANSEHLGILKPEDASALIRCYTAMKGSVDALKEFSVDAHCVRSRGPASVLVGDWDWIANTVQRINIRSKELLEEVDKTIKRLDTDHLTA